MEKATGCRPSALLSDAVTCKELVIIPGAGHNDIIYRCGRTYFETFARFANSLKPRAKN